MTDPGRDPSRDPPGLADIEAAARRLQGRAVVTPLLESPRLDERLGGRLLVKAEMLQVTGSFKFRGAYNLIAGLEPECRAKGVVAFSSGNHAQGVAAAARLLGAPAIIVMPDDAPAMKRRGTEGWGAEVRTYDHRDHDSREGIAAEIVESRGGTLVRPFDDARIIAGQGTVGLELMAQARALGAAPDLVLVPCGGGGLTAGVATAVRALAPETEVVTVEPRGFDDTRRSLAAGARMANEVGVTSLCDALLAPRPGALTFEINRRLVARGMAASDDEVLQAMATAFAELKLVVEPGGAVALAAALGSEIELGGRTVAVVCSGGNVDAAIFRRALEGSD